MWLDDMGQTSQGKTIARCADRSKPFKACRDLFPRNHVIRIANLKAGNHALAFLFSQTLARILQGPVDIATHGIADLGVNGRNQHLFEKHFEWRDVDSRYPWPSSQSLSQVILRRFREKLTGLQQGRQQNWAIKPEFTRFLIQTNVPNLYPLRSYSIDNSLLVEVEGAVCNVGYLPSLAEARLLLPGRDDSRMRAHAFHAEFEADPLIIHIRAGDILDGHHRLYIPTDPELIHCAASALPKQLAFIGQLEDNVLTRRLKAEFPDARFYYSGSAALDFEILRQARFLLLSTSTFAWLAAWLSERNEHILLPRQGLFNPDTAPEINLIDCSDNRFKFIVP